MKEIMKEMKEIILNRIWSENHIFVNFKIRDNEDFIAYTDFHTLVCTFQSIQFKTTLFSPKKDKRN